MLNFSKCPTVTSGYHSVSETGHLQDKKSALKHLAHRKTSSASKLPFGT
jgi:Mg2+/Co2+ transporter CorB